MPNCWKKVRTKLKAAKSDSGFLHRFKTSANPSRKTRSPPVPINARLDFDDDDETKGYASISTFNQYEGESQPSTSQKQSIQHYESLEYFNSDKPEIIYSKPNKKKSKSLPIIEVTHDDSSNSDEIVTSSQITGDNLSLQLSSDEKKRNINALITLSDVLKYNQSFKNYLVEDDRIHLNKERSTFNTTNLRQHEDVRNFPVIEDSMSTDSKPGDDEAELNLKTFILRLSNLFKKYQPELSSIKLWETVDDIDVAHLEPLLFAYDKTLKENFDVIQCQKNKILELEQRQQERNNQIRLLKDDNRIQLNHSKLLSEETNYEIQAYKKNEIENEDRISRLTQQISTLQDDNNNLQKTIENLKLKDMRVTELERQNDRLNSKLTHIESKNMKVKRNYRSVVSQLKKCISVEKHLKILQDTKSYSTEKEKTSAVVIQELNEELETNKEELLKIAAEKCHLEGQNATLIKNLRFAERKSIISEEQYQRTIDEFAVDHEYFKDFELVITELKADRDGYIKIIEQQQEKITTLKHRLIKGNLAKTKLENKLKKYQLKTTKQRNSSFLPKPIPDNHELCKNEIKRLNKLLEEETKNFHATLDEKRNLEADLELVWRLSSKENENLVIM